MNQTTLVWTILIMIAILAVALRQFSLASEPTIDAAIKDNALVLDVRTADEFAQRSVKGAINLPLDRLADEIGRLCPDHNRPILVHCLSGGRSAAAAGTLKKMGYTRVFNLGGIDRAEKLLSTH